MIAEKVAAVKKFYLLEYFYVLLKSLTREPKASQAFYYFVQLKEKHMLGESKYKRAMKKEGVLSREQERRFFYTFCQVIYEAVLFGLVESGGKQTFQLTQRGKKAMVEFEESGFQAFSRLILTGMEGYYKAFEYLVPFCYKANAKNNGLLILPNYSPLKLGISRERIRSTGDVAGFSKALYLKLQQDIKKYLKKDIPLFEANLKLLKGLIASGLIPEGHNDAFCPENYNKILSRFRHFWYSFFIKEIYEFYFSRQILETWIYRGKQFGLINATEFFPGFSGKLIYPVSIVASECRSSDFVKVFAYGKRALFLHEPEWEGFQEKFIDTITRSYFQLSNGRSVFVNLLDLRELACFKLRINEAAFSRYLEKAYQINLMGKLKIGISLEADKLPEETNAMYLKREAILIDGSPKNIISISVTGGMKSGAVS